MTTGTVTELWQDLLREGERRAGISLPESQESYVIFTLVRLSGDALIAGRTLALDLLDGLTDDNGARDDRLRDVGDRCLLVDGLFPGLAVRRGVGDSYYAALGQSAYGWLGDRDCSAMARLYAELAQAFRSLVAVLRSIRRDHASMVVLSPSVDDVGWRSGSLHVVGERRFQRVH